MTLKPIDMQVVLPKAQEVAKTKYIQDDNTQRQQAVFSVEFKRLKQIESKRTNKSSKSEYIKLNPDESNSKNKNGKDSNNSKNNKRVGRHIDIKI